jgi:hypothetical protein
MNPYVASKIHALRDVDTPLTDEKRRDIADTFELCDRLLTERTEALQRIGHITRGVSGMDLVRELPEHVARVMTARKHG